MFKRIPELDGLRAVAVMLVIVFHASRLRFAGGYIGVDIFFVLSGFLITSVLTNEFAATETISFRNFYIRRALRLFPALAVVLATYAAFALIFSKEPTKHIWADLAALFYVMNWVRSFDISDGALIGHTWSLAIEEQFYLLWPLILLACLKRHSKRLTLLVTMALIILCVGWRVWLVLHGASINRTYNGFDTRADSLFVGCLLSLGYDFPAVKQASKRWLPPAILLFAVIGFTRWDAEWMHLWGFTLVAIASAWLIVCISHGRPSKLKHALALPACTFIGRISYGMYLWHYPLMQAMFSKGLSVPAVMCISIPLTIAIATISYVFLEAPILKLKPPHLTRAPIARAGPRQHELA